MEPKEIQSEKELTELINNLIQKGNLDLTKLTPSQYSHRMIFITNKFINLYINSFSSKRLRILRNIKYIYTKYRKASLNTDYIYRIKNKSIIKRILLLIYLITYKIHITHIDIDSSKKYLYIRNLYNMIKMISVITAKLYLDKIIEITELETILKMLIIFTMNNKCDDIKEKSDIKHLMYFKECLRIILTIFKNKEANDLEQKFLINIFTYINSHFCFRDNSNKNMNYTNKLYLLHNDYKTIKLINLFHFIHKMNNGELSKIFFDFLSNIYFFQFSYNNLMWQYYALLEPILENIKEKKYETILNEVSFPEFQFNFIRELFSKERNFINKNPFIFKNALYFSGNLPNAGIIADIGQIQDRFLLAFGFNLIITEEEKKEYIIFQLKKKTEQKAQLKASILKNNNGEYYLHIIDSSLNEEGTRWKKRINPNQYYSYVILVDKKKNITVSYYSDINNIKKETFIIKEMLISNLFLTVGCDVEKINNNSNTIYNNYKIINSYTGFIGDIFIINTHLYKDKFPLEKNILNLRGKYGYTLLKSLWEQKSLNEYVTSNLEKTTNTALDNDDDLSIFKMMFSSDRKFKIIDNVQLYINSSNFSLVEYLDNIDYMNYNNLYHIKEKLLNKTKKEKQFFDNLKTKANINQKKLIVIGTSLFNKDFNFVENKSGLVKFVEEDGIFYMLLTLEYYYQVLFKISKDVIKGDNNDEIVLTKQQSDIVNIIEKGIENNVEFFTKKMIETNFKIRRYKIILFYYQMNVVIKQFMLLKNINNNIYKFLIKFLNRYQSLLKDFIHTNFDQDIIFYKNERNFFFDFLLNPRIYKHTEQFDLLTNLNNFLDSIYNIIDTNILTEEIFSENIFEKILNLVFIFKLKDKEKNLDKDFISFKKIKIKYLLILINYIQTLYSEKDCHEKIYGIINTFCDKLLSYKQEPIIFYYLSLVFFVSNSIIIVKEDFIKKMQLIFEENYHKEYIANKIQAISSMLFLDSYYLIFFKLDIDKLNQFKSWYSQLSQKTAYIYFANIFNIIFGGIYEIENVLDIAKSFKEEMLEDDAIKNKFFEKKENEINSSNTLSVLIRENIYTQMIYFSGFEDNLERVPTKSEDLLQLEKEIILMQEDKSHLKEKKNVIKVNIKTNKEINEQEIKKIKSDMKQEKYCDDYYTFLDDIKSRCFIYNPKNVLIKRFFAHIFHKSLFYCKAFMCIKNKYLNLFPEANMENKQLNYPSKIKNFSNIYEPKLFLKQNYDFYSTKYFNITHNYLIKDFPEFESINENKMTYLSNLLRTNIAKIDFYEHRYNISDILEEKERYFDCELINQQFTYFGFLIIGNDYIYFGTKNEEPIDLSDNNKDNIDINYITRYIFSQRDKNNQTKKKKTVILFYQDIKVIIKRRSFLMYQSFEIFCQNGKSYFFNLYRKENCENAFIIFSVIRDHLISKDKFELITENTSKEVKKVLNEVKNNTINNYLLLSKLNYLASRTFNDLSQYPVFPWLFFDMNKINAILNIEKSNIDKIEVANEQPMNIEENNEIIDMERTEINNAERSNEDLCAKLQLRNFSYPISLQTERKRQIFSELNYLPHERHYSTASYVLFYLIRSYPSFEEMLQLHNLEKENPNSLFISLGQLLKLLELDLENREAVPEFFSSFDFCCNLNCAFLSKKDKEFFVDDLQVNKGLNKSSNVYSFYFKNVYIFRKLINSYLISRFLPNWVDFVFGPKQTEKNRRSFYIFEKYSYEDSLKLDKKLGKYIKKYLNNEEMKNIDLRRKIKIKKDYLNYRGIIPHKILSSRVILNTSAKIKNIQDEIIPINEGIFFDKINDNILILYKTQSNDKTKKILLWNNPNTKNIKLFDKKIIYPVGYMKQLGKIKMDNPKLKIPIYKSYYSISKFIMFNKIFILTCRYLGNIFKVQNSDYCIDVFCEDFVSCITCKKNTDKSNDADQIIYTGLKNGKLIEWYIRTNLNDYYKINIKERNSWHCHQGEITCIEIYQNQNVLITAGKDKMIFIRKIFDFELLTAIDLNNCYMNHIINRKSNIIPTMIKISELNCLYVLLFNESSGKSFIRGYNLNGLFFAQSEEDYYMNICFTKNSNLFVSRYNQNDIQILNCYDLQANNCSINVPKFVENVERSLIKNNNNVVIGSKNESLIWNDYDSNNHELVLLFKNRIVRGNIKGKEEQNNLEYY